MPAGQKQERRVSPARSRSHHISSIAHLFLADEVVASDPKPMDWGASFCVAGAQRSGVTALVASRLASLAGGWGQGKGRAGQAGRVLLWEDERTPWSYHGYLTGCHLEERSRGQFLLPFPVWPVSHWPFCTKVMEVLPRDTNESGSSFPADGPVVVVQHLGHVDESTVRHLQRCVTSPSGQNHGLKGALGGQNLIWCLVGASSLSLVSCSRLGRLVNFLGVRQLFLLVFPDCWQGLGMPGLRVDRKDSAPAISLDLERALKLGQRVAPGRQVVVLPVETQPGSGSPDGLDEALSGVLARGLSAGSPG